MLKLGIIGAGNMGSAHAQNILEGKCPEIIVTAMADRKESRRAWIREKVPDAQVFSEGADLIRQADCDAVLIAVPHYQHPELAITDNMWYTSVPTVLPNTKTESDTLKSYTELSSSGKFGTAKDSENLYVDIIVNGLTGTPEDQADVVLNDWFGDLFVEIKNDAWHRLLKYYESL